MPCILALPGHQQQWHWKCWISRSLSFTGKDFNYLCQRSVERWQKKQMYSYVSQHTFSIIRVDINMPSVWEIPSVNIYMVLPKFKLQWGLHELIIQYHTEINIFFTFSSNKTQKNSPKVFILTLWMRRGLYPHVWVCRRERGRVCLGCWLVMVLSSRPCRIPSDWVE